MRPESSRMVAIELAQQMRVDSLGDARLPGEAFDHGLQSAHRIEGMTVALKKIGPLPRCFVLMELYGGLRKYAVRLIRAVWFSPLDSRGVGSPPPRDQNQREANAAFHCFIDSDYGEASTWRYRSGPLTSRSRSVGDKQIPKNGTIEMNTMNQ
jgi:hypothetical protein